MFSKQKRSYDPEALDPNRRLRSNLGDLIARNELPANRVAELANDINSVARHAVSDLVGPLGKKAARRLKGKFLKKSTWMPDYIAEVRVHNPRTNKIAIDRVPIQLIHEVVAVLLKHGFKSQLLDVSNMDPLTLEHLDYCKLQAAIRELMGLGIWGDGAPTQWDRNETIDVLSLSLPGNSKYPGLRIPLVAIPHSRTCQETWEDIFAIIKWSLEILATGVWPTARHDGSPWQDTDKCRKNARPLLRAALVEVRQDWKFAVEVFGFPAHNTVAGCCWKCTCTPNQIREVDSDASWRSSPLTHTDCLLRIWNSRRRLCPLLTAPWVKTRIFRMDWLHVADLGCTADFLGNFMHEVLHLFPGASDKDRCAAMYEEARAFYNENDVADRFDCFLPTFFDPGKGGPYKLRGAAAKIRALVPFAWKLAQEILDINDPRQAAVRQAAFHLDQVYQALSSSHSDPCATMREHGRKFVCNPVCRSARFSECCR